MSEQNLHDFGRQLASTSTLWVYAPACEEMPEAVQAIFWFAALIDYTGGDHDGRQAAQHIFPLSEQRNISFHRTGYPDVEVKITGRFGIDHIGTPVKAVPSGESRLLDDIGDDPAQMFEATQPLLPIQPKWSDFTVDGKPLFVECKSYLDSANQLVARAREL